MKRRRGRGDIRPQPPNEAEVEKMAEAIDRSGTPLLIGEFERNALRALRALAARKPVDMPSLMARLETEKGKADHMAQMSSQTVEIPVGFWVTFSIENGHPIGRCRHLSMSSPRQDRVPTPEAVKMVMAELGFVGGFEHCRVWQEDIMANGDNRRTAINVVQPLMDASSEKLN